MSDNKKSRDFLSEKHKPSHDKNIPRHIAIIPDGNRRYARKKGKPDWYGHKEGEKIFEKMLEWCKEAGVKEVSFWGMSTENLERGKEEVDFLLTLFGEICDKFLKEFKKKKEKDKVRIRFIGNFEKFPPKLMEKINKVMEVTKDYTDYRLNVLVGYGGRWEIIEAAKKIAKEVKDGKLEPDDITPDVFEKHLFVQSEPDLIIRTSEERLSGLFPWQGIYSEIIFLKDKYWPELTKEDFMACLENYANRPRRFGK